MNDVMPSPSQPRRSAIIWGIKISAFMDRINKITSTVKRLI